MPKESIHRRTFAAVMLLAFAITAVVFALFVAPTSATPAIPAALAVVATAIVVTIVLRAKMPDESPIDTFINLVTIATLFVATAIVSGFAKMIPMYGYRTAIVGFNDTGQGTDPGYHRRHRTTINDTGQMRRRHGGTTLMAKNDAMFKEITADGRAARGEVLVS